MNKVLKYNSLFLGTMILLFGGLKLVDPFYTWFHIQIAKSGLPASFIPLGIAGEISVGLSLLLATAFSGRIRGFFRLVVALASVGLIVNMAVATYVHLRPEVPASVLPLGIKPPFIPLSVMLLAGVNLFLLYRPRERARELATIT